MPDPGAPSPADEPADPPPSACCLEEPLLTRLEIELPDGRYFLAYRHVEEALADA